MCVEFSGGKERRKNEGQRRDLEEGGADFNPVASGLRQFGFQPPLESRRQASEEPKQEEGWQITVRGRVDRPLCLLPIPGLGPLCFAPLFSALGKALSLHIQASEPS